MRITVRNLACLALVACGNSPQPTFIDAGVDANSVALQLPAGLAAAQRVLWVGAHPDDETTVSPLLGQLCLKSGVKCTFLVFTRGEGGNCGLADCGLDLGAFRALEMQRSAAKFNADVVQWDLGNKAAITVDDALENFAQSSGSTDMLLQKIGNELTRIAPDAVLTFDPRNGVTCHPDHRAASAATIAAIKARSTLSLTHVWMVDSQLVTDGSDLEQTAWIGNAAKAVDPAAMTIDVSGRDQQGVLAWERLLGTLNAHASQFSSTVIAKFAAAPSAQRTVTLLPLSDAIENDARYACSN
jgi:LmbE family N-acetylglucosaminyl deacetylase